MDRVKEKYTNFAMAIWCVSERKVESALWEYIPSPSSLQTPDAVSTLITRTFFMSVFTPPFVYSNSKTG